MAARADVDHSSAGTFTLLTAGTVLMSGGWICCGSTATPTASAGIYHPPVLGALELPWAVKQ